MAGVETFRFLNETRTLTDTQDWNDPEAEKLWLYNLHYFDDLNAENAADRKEWHTAVLKRWVSENPPGTGNGWEPYPSSLRIVNWIKWVLAGNGLTKEVEHSLAVQVRYLTGQMEYHLLGNHLFANAKALVFAGAFFRGQEAENWMRTGLGILRREIPEQVMSDGGQFERSPMYHGLALEDMCDLINILRAFPESVPDSQASFISTWPAIASKMADWLGIMCHPDGEIALLNDAAFGIAPSPERLFAYCVELGIIEKADVKIVAFSNSAMHSQTPPYPPQGGTSEGQFRSMVQSPGRLVTPLEVKESSFPRTACPRPDRGRESRVGGDNRQDARYEPSFPRRRESHDRWQRPQIEQHPSITHLTPSGYIRIDTPIATVFLDTAPIGPDYLPGHAHADTLSFELSLFGHRVIVDSGTSCYGLGEERLRQRSTPAHNTVVIDDENSSEVWSGFRVARRAYPRDLAITEGEDLVTVSCNHDGYRRLPGKPVHEREWRVWEGGMRITDRVTGRCASARARLHLHPEVGCRVVSKSEVSLVLPGGECVALRVQGGCIAVQESTYHPEFGVSLKTVCLEIPFEHKLVTELVWL
jgi:uncharacterized heparinase superfamily protein